MHHAHTRIPLSAVLSAGMRSPFAKHMAQQAVMLSPLAPFASAHGDRGCSALSQGHLLGEARVLVGEGRVSLGMLAVGRSVDQQEPNPGRDCADHQHSQQGEKGVGILALNPRIMPTLVY
jgi:hypothetical protein